MVPQLRFRYFSNLEFLQSVDKPRYLSRLLEGHAGFFARHGLDVGALTNDDACARQLLRVFAEPLDDMPGELLHALFLIDALADEAGHERILEEADRCEMDLATMPDDIAPGDFALAVWLEQPRLVRICHEKTVCHKVKRYYEYRSRDYRRLGLDAIREKVAEMESTLAPWFGSRKRSETCEVFVYEQGDEIRLLVTHGGLFRTDGSITGAKERSRIAYRPQRHDSIIYDTATGLLKIHAQFRAERDTYRAEAGRILFGDPDYFAEGDSYRLDALRANGGMLSLVDGMNRVRLTEVCIDVDGAPCNQETLKGEDLTALVAGCDVREIMPGEIVRACFSIDYTSGGRERKLEVRLPNVADHDRERDGPIVEAFLRANNFLVAANADGIKAGELVAAA